MARPPQTENLSPPIVGYGSLVSFFDHMNTFGDPPNVINNRVLPSSFSGTTIALTLRALRFFDLIDEDGKPDEARLKAVMDPETRRDAIVSLLEEKYPGLFALPLSKAGPGEIRDYFGTFGMDATAVRKARSFFLQAAKDNGIAVHGSVVTATRTRTKTGKRKIKDKGQNGNDGQTSTGNVSNSNAKHQKGDVKTISLSTGNGEISLAVYFEPISLSTEDRKFIFELIDKLNAYEESKGA